MNSCVLMKRVSIMSSRSSSATLDVTPAAVGLCSRGEPDVRDHCARIASPPTARERESTGHRCRSRRPLSSALRVVSTLLSDRVDVVTPDRLLNAVQRIRGGMISPHRVEEVQRAAAPAEWALRDVELARRSGEAAASVSPVILLNRPKATTASASRSGSSPGSCQRQGQVDEQPVQGVLRLAT